MRAVTVVGIGEDGCGGLSSRAVNAVASAEVLAGGSRHLAFFPQFRGERVVVDRDVAGALERVASLADEHQVCVLASGDPLFFGLGARLVERLGAEHVEVLPHPTSVQWAFARAGLPWDDAAFVSLHGRGRTGLVARLRRVRKAAVLTDRSSTPAAIARHLADHGETGFAAWVCERVGGAGERVRRMSLGDLAGCQDVDPLNVLLLVREDPGWRPPPALRFLREEDLAMRRPRAGLVTKREVRALSLAALGVGPADVVWDVGAGSGSVALEAAALAYDGRVYAVEREAESAAHCRENARRHGADNVLVVEGTAPEALLPLERPHAVFVGGSGGGLEAILALATERLAPGGRVVVNAVTLETLEASRRALAAHGFAPEVTQVSIARGAPLAGRLRLEPLAPVFVVAGAKPGGGAP